MYKLIYKLVAVLRALYYRKLGIKFCFKDSSVQTIYLFFGLSSGICLAPCLPWVRWNSFKLKHMVKTVILWNIISI